MGKKMRTIIVKCSECKTPFERPANSRRRVCSTACEKKRDARIKLESARKAKGGLGKCLHCGADLPSLRHRYCPLPACQKERKRQNNLAAALRYAELMKSSSKRQCVVCGKWFDRRSDMFVTCGREQCVKTRARQVKNERNRKQAEALKRRRQAEGFIPVSPIKVDTMPCPWSSGQLTHPPATGYGWHTAEADPMSAGWAADGLWFVVRESETERERRAA